MHKQCFYVVLDLEVSDRTHITRADLAGAMRDLVDVPQATYSKDMYWVELATAFDSLPELQVAAER